MRTDRGGVHPWGYEDAMCGALRDIRAQRPRVSGGGIEMRDCLLEPRKGTRHSLHDLLRYEAANLIAKAQYDAAVSPPGNADVDFGIVDSLEFDQRIEVAARHIMLSSSL
jgi:hypothetical protein